MLHATATFTIAPPVSSSRTMSSVRFIRGRVRIRGGAMPSFYDDDVAPGSRASPATSVHRPEPSYVVPGSRTSSRTCVRRPRFVSVIPNLRTSYGTRVRRPKPAYVAPNLRTSYRICVRRTRASRTSYLNNFAHRLRRLRFVFVVVSDLASDFTNGIASFPDVLDFRSGGRRNDMHAPRAANLHSSLTTSNPKPLLPAVINAR